MQLEEYFKVNVLKEQKLLYTKICGSVTHEEFKTAMLHVVDLINKYKLASWLIDATATNFTLQDQRWVVENLGRLLSDTTLRRVAMARREDLFLEMAAENMRYKIYETFGHTIALEHFPMIEDAMHWLAPELVSTAALSGDQADL